MDDLISEFITETTENIAVLDLELVKLEQNPQDDAILGNIFRIVHTIKGTCGFLGLPRLEAVAHASENVLGKIRDKVLVATPQAVTLILESLDNIKGLIDHLSNHGAEAEGDDADLIARLNYYAETGEVQGSAAVIPLVSNGHDTRSQALPDFDRDDEPTVAPQNAAVASPKQGESASANQSIRVNLDVLENLMQTVSELVLTRNQLMQIMRTRDDKELMAPLQHLNHITSELQEGIMKTRMQPIGNAWSKFPRLIRDLSHDLGKKIELKMIGEETELDRQLLEVIKDPLTHMVRNSCDHGLETPEERRASGKSEMGTVTLSAYHEGGHIIIKITDDGRGINLEKVKQKAVSNGLATEAALAGMSDKQIAQFIFHAGFSTAEKVTAVSGRGVGMDVVRTNIESIGGAIELESTWGKGSQVIVKIPLTLAIVSVLLVEASGQKFAIPQINVLELVRVAPNTALSMETINNALVLRLRGELLPLIVLSEILGHPVDRTVVVGKSSYIAVCNVGNRHFGIVVDHVFDTEEIVVKPVSNMLKEINVYAGNTILGDGSVIMILDPTGVANRIGAVDTGEVVTAVKDTKELSDKTGFLLFSMSKGAPKAVPLELVSRLEEIDVKAIEVSGDTPVVQYRGGLMCLTTLENEPIPDTGMMDVIVFNYDRKLVGLIVKEIMDITHETFTIKLTTKESRQAGYLGNMVIAGKTTDIVDVGSLFSGLSDIEKPAIANGDGKVLFVEDSPFFRSMTVPFLSDAGYKVTAVETAKEALEMLNSGDAAFDLIITDIDMPDMNGFEFATTCRAMPKLADMPIVAFTSTVNEEVIQKSKASGMRNCIVKSDRPGLLEAMAHCVVGAAA